MSVTTLTRVQILTTVALVCLNSTAMAEWGKGTVQDPITLQYTDDVEKDWIEGIRFHSETGNYVITYKDHYGFFNQLVYEPTSKIEPTLRSKLRQTSNLAIRYQYSVRNGKAAQQNIVWLSTFVSNLNAGSPMDPPGWEGFAMPGVKTSHLKLSWSYVGKDRQEVMSGKRIGIAPGGKADGFALESNDLPGVAPIEFRGQRITNFAWLGNAPEFHSPIGQEVEKLKVKNVVHRVAAVPLVRVETPYNGAAVLDSLRVHITQDIVELKLIEPQLAAELDRVLQAAAEAIRRNSLKAARDHLHDAFKLVHKAHPDVDKDDWEAEDDDSKNKGKAGNVHPIDRLAARVIAFDLKYIEKRLN
ncbi:MAG TPA: hypothetical protein VNO43_17065 [Candidatus Eisenbacteria bacterium]|nr:hypothetical protein [Candidatus Eisenbacteria bacterium]